MVPLPRAAGATMLPPDALLVPAVAVPGPQRSGETLAAADAAATREAAARGEAAAPGDAGGPELLLGLDEAGRLVAEAFTSPARLVARWGPRQPWVAWSRQDLAVVLVALDVDVVVLDAGSGHGRTVHARRDREPDA